MTIRVRTKIIISFVSVLAVLSFLVGITYLNRNLLIKSMLHMEDQVNTLDAFAGLQLSIDMVVMPANDYLINGDPIERERFRNIADEVEEGFKRLEGLERHKEHALLLQGAKEKFILLKEMASEIFALPSPIGDKKGARLMKEMDAVSHEIIISYLDKYNELIKGEVRKEIDSANVTRERVDMLLVTGTIISLITTCLFIVYLVRSILKPILLFKNGAFIIGSGNLDHRIDIRDGLEINYLADEFNKMALKLKESYGGLEKKVEERTRELNVVNERLKELSITDGLTGAYNHRYFYEALTKEIKRSERYGFPVSLIMADIDQFKRYNDRHGHVEGDNVIKGIASCIMSGVRGEDIVARYGGEEFSIILPETAKEDAGVLAERIRCSIRDYPFPYKETQPGGSITVSFGIATFPDDADDTKDLIIKADAALYRAKDKGRNRVELHFRI